MSDLEQVAMEDAELTREQEGQGEKTGELTFEAALSELERVVRKLESGEATLDQSMDLFKQGTELSAYCEKKLNAAETTVNQLVEGPDGQLQEEPFNLPD